MWSDFWPLALLPTKWMDFLPPEVVGNPTTCATWMETKHCTMGKLFSKSCIRHVLSGSKNCHFQFCLKVPDTKHVFACLSASNTFSPVDLSLRSLMPSHSFINWETFSVLAPISWREFHCENKIIWILLNTNLCIWNHTSFRLLLFSETSVSFPFHTQLHWGYL